MAAVFASIIALAVGINGGALDKTDVQNIQPQQKDVLRSIFPKSIDIFSMISSQPEATKTVVVNVTAEGEEYLKVSQASISAGNLTSYSTDGFSVSSDSELVLTGFEGKITVDNTTEVSGSVSGYVTSGVNSSKDFRFEKELNSDTVYIKGAYRVKVDLSEVSGTVKSKSSTSRIDSSSLSIDSFTGNITLRPSENRYIFEGRIHKLEAGSLAIKASED